MRRVTAWPRQLPPGMWPYAALFLLALFLRLIFIYTQPQIPPWGDVVAYAGIATGMGHFVLHGDVHPMTGALYFSRGPFLPSLYAAAFAAYFRNDFSVLSSLDTVLSVFDWGLLRHAQAMVDSLTCVGVALIGARAIHRRAGLAAGGLAALYPPFILWVGQPLREVWMAFGLTAAVLLTLTALDHKGWGWQAACGLAWAVTSQMVPGPIGLGLLAPWLGGVALAAWREQRPLRQVLAAHWPALAAFGALWLARWGFMYLVLGRISEGALGVGATGGFWNQLATSGWRPDGFTPGAAAFGAGPAGGSVGQIAASGLAALARAPGPWVSVLARNVVRLWAYPYNTFQQVFLLGWQGQVFVHQALLAIIPFTLPLALMRHSRLWLAALPPLYITLVFGAESVETRFVSMALPLLLPVAALGLMLLWDLAQSLDRRTRITAGMALAGIGIYQLAQLPHWLAALPSLPPVVAQASRLALGAALAGTALVWLARRAGVNGAGWLGVPLLLGAAGIAAIDIGVWHAWPVTLAGAQSPPQVVEQTIALPPGGLGEGRVVLLADFEASDTTALAVRVNGVLIKPPGEALAARQLTADFFYDTWLRLTGQAYADLRQWWVIPLPDDLLDGVEAASIEAWVDAAYPNDWARVYGDYPGGGGPGMFAGPRFPFGGGDTSLYKFRWDLRGEPRLDGLTALASQQATARYFDGQAWRDDDLSNQSGRQTGVYRLRLAVLAEENPGGALEAAEAVIY